VAVPALAQSIGGGVLLGDEGYRGEELFDWLYEEADSLRVMPSDGSSNPKGRPSAVSRARQQGESSFSGLWRRFIGRV
jgi:hypothetical protein